MHDKYEKRMVASIAGIINRELAKNTKLTDKKEIPLKYMPTRASENGMEKEDSLYDIIKERKGRTGEAQLTNNEILYLIDDVNMLVRFIKENLERDDYQTVKDYSERTIKDCELLMGCNAKSEADFVYLAEIAKKTYKRADIMLVYKEKGKEIIRLETALGKAIKGEHYETAARIRDEIDKLRKR